MADSVLMRRTAERTLVPPVDIYETAEGITLIADLPGVSPKTLDIRIEQDRLTIEGTVDLEMPENLKPLYAEVHSSRYYRSFTLSPELNPEKVDAKLRHGVLTLSIPKREEFKPKRIEVKVAE